ncbi:MepB family protein [Flavobacterium sp. N502540]|uniref:MepB family protein n=1 Tax=Flavobacterium sp. N502540 TaxID=2986838 RepID=UPI00222400BC|nr:MepB family protein [Flavobacterium sp. N502540]
MILKNNWTDPESLPKDLIIAKEILYDCCDFDLTEPQPEAESNEYDAYRFRLNQKNICYRKAKITPTKTGQFVTLWKRNTTGIIEAFDFTDAIDLVIVSVRKNELFGQFVFPKPVLLEKGIFTTSTKEGKRATRVYPPWDETTSKQAQKTQQWQLNYFYFISPETNLKPFKTLF